jgi:hypothetical protein
MNENTLGNSLNQSHFWNIDRDILGSKEDPENTTPVNQRFKKRNKENLADRFIPSKISSNAYNLFVPEKPHRQEDITAIKKSQRIDTYEALLSQQILGEPLKSKANGKKIMHFNQENSNVKENSFMKPQTNVK